MMIRGKESLAGMASVTAMTWSTTLGILLRLPAYCHQFTLQSHMETTLFHILAPIGLHLNSAKGHVDVLHTSVMPSPNCYTDHRLHVIRSKVLLAFTKP